MTRRFSLAVAVMIAATWILIPSLASAQEASPPAVLPQVLEQAPELPRTGSDPFPLLVVALALVAVGAVLVLGARKRRTADAATA
ncbi:MAG: LPXTG cell wall anchor domain-containing protein [Acidimicrobiales bacterium]